MARNNPGIPIDMNGAGMECPEDYQDQIDEIQREILQECMEYGEDMARSDEEGWFYADNDVES